jgi:DNA polymerase III alpha subunit
VKTNKFSEIIFDEDDLCDLVMQGHDISQMRNVLVDPSVNIEKLIYLIQDPGQLMTWTFPDGSDRSVPEFDSANFNNWLMPKEYKQLDIAKMLLDLCKTPEQLQRVGQELLLYQHYNLFDLLRYLKYLVDIMHANHVIWGVGRGSSVSSYVLYLLGVHRIDSMYYDLDPREFLR